MAESETDATLKVLSWFWERKDEIAAKLRDVYAWFRGTSSRKDKRGILILGPGGTGKTTLARLLSGQCDLLLDLPGEYDESIGIERYALSDAPNVEVVVPPGQEHRREATWANVLADLTAGKYRGVILISAYGYHSLGSASYKEHRLYGGVKDTFLKVYLEDRRNEEIRVLQQVSPPLTLSRGKLWIMTLVAKQDLWWPKRSEVAEHYGQGPYGVEIKSILKDQNRREFRHELILGSLVISNFVTGVGERLKANAEGYDHREHAQSLRRLFETIDALRKWESEK